MLELTTECRIELTIGWNTISLPFNADNLAACGRLLEGQRHSTCYINNHGTIIVRETEPLEISFTIITRKLFDGTSEALKAAVAALEAEVNSPVELCEAAE